MIQLEIPQEVPVGETFCFKDKRTKYVCVQRSAGCEDCALDFTKQQGRQRRADVARRCECFACHPTQRTDANFVKAVKLGKKESPKK